VAAVDAMGTHADASRTAKGAAGEKRMHSNPPELPETQTAIMLDIEAACEDSGMVLLLNSFDELRRRVPAEK
jgi:hypothetical protein